MSALTVSSGGPADMSERRSKFDVPLAYSSAGAKRAERVSSARGTSDINLFGDRQGVIDLETEVAHRALHALMSE
jgi:hypothetical protein